MNIMEAIASGKKFRRPKWLGWVGHEDVQNFVFSVEDLTATDYYVELKKVEITEQQFEEAWKPMLLLLREPNVSPNYIKQVLREGLGL